MGDLPDVGDLCLVVIQKWMYHIMYGPTSPSICLIWYPELWLCVSIHALDMNDMNATSNSTFELLFRIRY